MRNTISLLIQKRDLFLLFIMNIVFALSIQLVTSLQTLFIGSLGANALEIGIVISAQGFVSALFTIPISLITKKIGEKLLLLISAILAIVTPIMYIFAKSWQSLLPWVMIYGVIFSIFVVTRMSLIAAHSTPQNRATIYSVFNITWSIGSLFGPLMAGLLADLYGWNALFSVASLISFLSIVSVLLMRESSKNVRLYVETENSAKSLNNNFRILQIILFISLVQLVMCTSVGVIGYIMPLYLTGIFEASKTQVGLFLSIGVGVSTLLIQIPSGIAADKYGNTNMMLLSALLTPILFLFPLWFSQYTQLAVIYMVIFASYSIVWPSSIAFLIDAVPYSKRSFAIGARQTAVRLGFTIGPLIGGYLWHLYTLGQLEPTFAFYISALSSGLSIPVILLLKKMEVTDT